ncbi:copper transporter 5.1 [Cajanus cajan]|uniref:Copper transport protein n=1 Tax=Cajanus cajan TaxID=3821 RepID=A0A151RSY0_CAJCA|nr:copper transporter 5.1 [Cajanus cajan]KYP45623.1 Copper transporter 1 [Cajanus cajan]
MMHMTFYWSKNVTLLIGSWKTNDWTEYILSLFACLVVSVFYQVLENRRIRLKLIGAGKPFPPEIETPLLRRKLAGNRAKVAGAFLFGLSSAIGYLLMLAVMSFNGGVFVAIVVGLAIGYFFFRNEGEDSLIVDTSCACA